MSKFLEHSQFIKDSLLAGHTYKFIGMKLGNKMNCNVASSNLVNFTKQFFNIYRCPISKKIASVDIKNFTIIMKRTKRGLKPQYMFFNETKRGVCKLPIQGQCKFLIGDYPFELCNNDISKGSYCKEHNNLCYRGVL